MTKFENISGKDVCIAGVPRILAGATYETKSPYEISILAGCDLVKPLDKIENVECRTCGIPAKKTKTFLEKEEDKKKL